MYMARCFDNYGTELVWLDNHYDMYDLLVLS